MTKKDNAVAFIGILIRELIKTVLAIWSFFDCSVWSFGVFLVLPLEVKKEWEKRKRERLWELNLAFQDALLYLKNALVAGYAPEGSMRAAYAGLEQLYSGQHPICREFRRMLSKMELGSSMEEVWLAFGNRSGSEDIRQFAETLAVVKRTGGDLGAVLRQTGDVMQEKVELKRELHVVLAAKETEFRIMSMVPQGILLYLQFFAPSMSEGLYHNTFGIVFMWCVFLLYTGIRFWGERMLQKEIAG